MFIFCFVFVVMVVMIFFFTAAMLTMVVMICHSILFRDLSGSVFIFACHSLAS